MGSSLVSILWSGIGGRTSLLGRQKKQHDCLWQRTPFSKCSLFRKGNNCIHFTGYKTDSLLRMNRKQRQSDAVYWLDFSSTCRPRLVPQDVCNPYSPWATSGVLCHRGILHGLHTLPNRQRDPLYLTSGRGLLTGPLEISLHLKITPSGRNPPHPPPAIHCWLQLPV